MKVSVVLPNLNMGRYLRPCLESLYSQTLKDFEILFIDGGSKDDSLDIVNSYGSDRVRIFKATGGLQKSINLGFNEAKGDFIARLDADDVCYPHRFERQVTALESEPDTALCWTDAWRMDSQGSTTGFIWACSNLTNKEFLTGKLFSGLLRRNIIPHGTVMIRRSSLGSMRMNENLRYMEDWDLWLRLSQHNRFVHCHGPLYGYRTHPGASQSFRNVYRHVLWRGLRGPQHWLDTLELTPRQRGSLALTMATSPALIIGSGLIGRRPDTMKPKHRVT